MTRIGRFPETIWSNDVPLNAVLEVLEKLVLGPSGERDAAHICLKSDFPKNLEVLDVSFGRRLLEV